MAMEETTSTNNNSNSKEIMLFGVRLVVDSMRKSVSLNNLSQYQHHLDSSPSNDVVPVAAGGYVSADEPLVHRSSGLNRDRKRGVPWSEEEHKLFLIGLQKVGKGDWRGISRNFVKTRTPTQVASHAQKYFLRKNNLKSKSRRRSSLFDITTDTVIVNELQINNGDSQPNPPAQPQQDAETSRFSNTTGPVGQVRNNEMVDDEIKRSMANDSLSLSLSLSLMSSTPDPRLTSSFQRDNNIISVA